jgi:RNAse (barnase) inhibitor barstar
VTDIPLDGSGWRTPEDFYTSLLAALGAPAWHGHNLDALSDSLGGGGINKLNPPIRVTIYGYQQMTDEARRIVDRFREPAEDLMTDGVSLHLDLPNEGFRPPHRG